MSSLYYVHFALLNYDLAGKAIVLNQTGCEVNFDMAKVICYPIINLSFENLTRNYLKNLIFSKVERCLDSLHGRKLTKRCSKGKDGKLLKYLKFTC